jgi:hypothetical protein
VRHTLTISLSPDANPDTETVAQVGPPAIEEAQYPAKSRVVAVYSERIQQRRDDLKNKRNSAKKITAERKSNAEASRLASIHERRDKIV